MKKPASPRKLGLSKSSDRKEKRPFGRKSERFDDKPKGRRNDFSRPSRPQEERTLHEITCAQCGNVDTVPFKPTTNKPVLCKNCFSKDDRRDSKRPDSRPRARREGMSRDSRPHAPRDFSRGESNAKQFDELNKKLDKILALLDLDAELDEDEDIE